MIESNSKSEKQPETDFKMIIILTDGINGNIFANGIENIPEKFLEYYTCILCSIGNNERKRY